jgi:hypothetical protein
MDAAGVQPGADLPQERLEAIRDLAEVSVTRDLVEGRLRGVQAMSVAGIARRHIAKAEAATTDGSGSAVVAREAFADWLVETVNTVPIESDGALRVTVSAIEAVVPELLLPRANAESDPYALPSAHRVAILGWFSGRPEVPAGDVLEWAKAQVLEVIEQHGSLVAWHAFQQAEDVAERVRSEVVRAEIEARAATLRAEAEQGIHDGEARARRAAAELSRRST